MKKKSPLKTVAALLAATLVTVPLAMAEDAGGGSDGQPPNILFILADDMGYSDLGCYGAVKIETPNLDRLAENGLRFSQFYNSGRCWPSRTALLSGFYPQQMHGDNLPGVTIMNRPDQLEHRRVADQLVPHRLRKLGYRTYRSGKVHDVFHRLDPDGPRALDHMGFDRGYNLTDYNRFFGPKNHTLDNRPLPTPAPEEGYYATTAVAQHTIDFLKDHAANHADKPFFSYVAFIAPHFPLHALPEDIAKYRDAFLEGWDTLRNQRAERLAELGFPKVTPAPRVPDIYAPAGLGGNANAAHAQIDPLEVVGAVPWDSLTDEQKRFQATKMAIHAAMVDRMDREIGRIVDQLKAMGVYENTIIFFASDNGADASLLVRGDGHDPDAPPGSAGSYLCLGPGWAGASNSPFNFYKMFSHEGGTATTMIVHWPKGIQDKGAWRHAPGHFIDVGPTLVKLAGGTWEGTPSPGVDLSPVFAADVALDRPAPLWWNHSLSVPANKHRKAVRDGDWKAVQMDERPWELYNLADDRGETTDLAAQHPERLEALKAKWQEQTEAILKQIAK